MFRCLMCCEKKQSFCNLPFYVNNDFKLSLSKEAARCLSSILHTEQPEKPKPERKPRSKNGLSDKEPSVSSNIKEYFKSKPCLSLVSGFVPERFLRMKKSPSYYNFVVDDEVAAQFVSLIKGELQEKIPIIEANPGLGLLTRYLLKAGLPHITVFDPAFHPLPPLSQLMNDNPERISVIPSNFFEVYRFIAQDKMDNGDRFYTMFKDFKFKEWKEEPSFKVVGALCSSFYIHCIIKSIAFNDAFVKLGRVQHLIAVTDDIFKHIAGDRNSARLRTLTLFNLFFDIEVKGQFPRISFLPWDKGKDNRDMNKRIMYVVKITPKADIYEQFSDGDLKVLWYFLQDLCRSKRNKVIAYFEKWIPWSGLKLIKEGLSPQTEVQDLSGPELVQLFRIFTSLPEFTETNYVHVQESGLLTDVIETVTSPKDRKINKIGFS